MFTVISAFGLLIAAIGLWGFILPKPFMRAMQTFVLSSKGLYIIFGFRLLLGSLLLIAAPMSHYSTLFYVVGVLALFDAMVTLMLGPDNIERYMQWWLLRPAICLRVMMLIAWLLGVVLIYVSLLSIN
ncbi:hypothetical protein imdm_1522 [gamma proteobacterium IMCC2047]|nr:hypothetical protein imdm_1522 [gamma proteobacterium IMCC2047]